MNDDAVMEAIAEHVHRAWADEKIRQGFADHVWPPEAGYELSGVGDAGLLMAVVCARHCGLPEAQHHTDMLPYADLPEHIKDYDRACCRAVFDGITAAGYRLEKNEAAARAN